MSSDADWKDDDADWVDDGASKHSATASAGMHALQQATGGFSDELSGLGEAAGRMVGLEGVGSKPALQTSLAKGGPTLDWDVLKEAYQRARDHERQNLKDESTEHPFASGAGDLAGMIASPLNKLGAGQSLAKGGAILGGINGLGQSEADTAGGMLGDTALGTALGGFLGKGADVAGPYVGKAVQYAGSKLGNAAEKLAVNATGATGAQAAKFPENAGRELLDRKLVQFGDKPANVAARTGQAMETAGADINQSLKGLDQQGVTANIDQIVKNLEERAASYDKDPSKAGIAKKIRGIIDDIYQSGESQVPISAAEETKRGFNKAAGNWMDPEAGQAGKQAYLSYMDEVERAAKAADPTLASKFQEGKDTYGLLAPIQEAAERRGLTQSQSPFGGLGDFAAAGAGGAMSGGPGAALSLAAKKTIAPRVTSSGAVALDKVSKLLQSSPQMAELAQKSPQVFNAIAQKMESTISGGGARAAGNDSRPYDKDDIIGKIQGTKYSTVLQNAAQKGDQAFAAAHFILQSKDPEYRKALDTSEQD